MGAYRCVQYDRSMNSSVIEKIKVVLLLVVAFRVAHGVVVMYNFTYQVSPFWFSSIGKTFLRLNSYLVG